MFNLSTIQYKNNSSEVYGFITTEYQAIDGGNHKRFKHTSIYSAKAVVNKLVKHYQFEPELNSGEQQKLKQLIKGLTNQFDLKIIKQYLKYLKTENAKYQKKLLVVLEHNDQSFNTLLLEYLISCQQIRNYMILPVGKLIDNRSLFQKKASSFGYDPVGFFQGLETDYNTDEQFKIKLNELYMTDSYQQILESMSIDCQILNHQPLKACRYQEEITSYITMALNILNTRQAILSDKYQATTKYQEYINKNLVLEVQEEYPSNKVTLLKLFIIVTGAIVPMMPLISITEDYEGNTIVGLSLFIIGYIIIELGVLWLKWMKNKMVIDNWLKLIISYELILFGLGITLVAIDLDPYLFWFGSLLGVARYLDRLTELIKRKNNRRIN